MSEDKQKDESMYIFDKKFTCPVCNKEFTAKQVKTGKARFLGTEEDLRPLYLGVDTVKYDIVMCTNCGYASVARELENVTPKQKKLIKEEIGSKYKAVEENEEVYSYATAIRRCKMALLTAMTKPAKLSETSYICLKLSWLYKGAVQELEEENPDDGRIENYKSYQKQYIKKAYDGFTEALLTEYPPICNMDEMTINYLMAVLAFKCDDFESAHKYAYMVISSRSASSSLKEKTHDLVDKIKASERK